MRVPSVVMLTGRGWMSPTISFCFSSALGSFTRAPVTSSSMAHAVGEISASIFAKILVLSSVCEALAVLFVASVSSRNWPRVACVAALRIDINTSYKGVILPPAHAAVFYVVER